MGTKHGITWTATLAAVALPGMVIETKATPWTMPAGQAEHFSYANGQTLNVRDTMGGAAKGSITPPPRGAGTGSQKSGTKPAPQGGAKPKTDRQPG